MYIIYGCGGNAKYVLSCIDNTEIDGYVDCTRFRFQDRDTMSITEAIKLYPEDIFIITPDLPVALDIFKDVKEKKVKYCLFWTLIWNADSPRKYIEDFQRLTDEEKLFFCERERIRLYEKQLECYRKQIQFVMKHVNPAEFRPAVGRLREHQLETVRYAAEFIESIETLQIQPILTYGNLLGVVRHGGFIPWDDDIDFDLIRPQYELLRKYCHDHIRCLALEEVPLYRNIINSDCLNMYLKDEGDCFFVEDIGLLQIRSLRNGRVVHIDFFSLDSYKDELEWDIHKEMVSEYLNDVGNAKNWKEFAELERRLVKRDEKYWAEGKRFYPGLDNFVTYSTFDRNIDSWIDRDTIFPLKKVMFEGESFYAPNNIDKYLKFCYGDSYMMLREDFAIHMHYDFDNE